MVVFFKCVYGLWEINIEVFCKDVSVIFIMEKRRILEFFFRDRVEWDKK